MLFWSFWCFRGSFFILMFSKYFGYFGVSEGILVI
jgi:hypothetical protein